MMRHSSLFALALLVLSLSSCYYYYPAEPMVSSTPVSSNSYSARSVSSSSGGQLYVVQRGDTLYRIARRYGRSVNQLMAWNNIQSAHNLQVGQRLWVTPPSNSRVYLQ